MTSGRGDGPFVIAVAVSLFAFALVNTFSVLDEVRGTGRRLAFWEPLVWETSSIVVIMAMLPIILRLVRRFWPLDPPWPRTVAIQAAGLLAFAVIHITAMGVLRWAVYAVLGGYYAPFSPLGDFLYEFRKDALGYAGFVFLYVLWRRQPSQPQAEPSAERGAIEVRDGAVRHFVPLAEVAWIEAAGNYVELHRGQTPILHRAPLSQMERQLQGAGFIRIHRSRLVRRDAIAQVESKPSGDYLVRLTDGRELAGSRRYRRPLLEP
ncbi:MAG: LytTR family transcriptional regulator [Alphaproteobacteria bacterium]|nr:LytTR family transcriptional regulator [Alphaproteobacteria bacterium]MBU1516894.1 LytTR family transcriptional regulator [Alphaproteobacteria bacterium]MBU2092589.1 LytTR family transcriptional regulator [Alphaproteobacteria bacterium]MBU2151300.1 LytTR family transcriptional regulator [Alphaproteobacteria bacterium]MBU2309602.1 LytTR family transcriptional regulator [Alphaproteobacteria bacterium]